MEIFRSAVEPGQELTSPSAVLQVRPFGSVTWHMREHNNVPISLWRPDGKHQLAVARWDWHRYRHPMFGQVYQQLQLVQDLSPGTPSRAIDPDDAPHAVRREPIGIVHAGQHELTLWAVTQ